jgi:hypothetical protein
MTIDHVTIDTLMTWARAHAPYVAFPAGLALGMKRRVRLEIAAVPYIGYANGLGQRADVTGAAPTHERVQVRVYLAEPRCRQHEGPTWHNIVTEKIPYECGPLAETRIG